MLPSRSLRGPGFAIVGWAVVLLELDALVPLAERGASAGDDAGDQAVGEQIYATNCSMCHGVDASGSGDVPSLRGVVDRLGADQVATTIRQGRQAAPPMPAFGDRLDDAEIDDVIAYLAEFDDAEDRTQGTPPREGSVGADDGRPDDGRVVVMVGTRRICCGR